MGIGILKYFKIKAMGLLLCFYFSNRRETWECVIHLCNQGTVAEVLSFWKVFVISLVQHPQDPPQRMGVLIKQLLAFLTPRKERW